MRGVDSSQLLGIVITLAHLAPPTSEKRTGDKLGNIEKEVVDLAIDLFERGAFQGMKEGFNLRGFLSFILRRSFKCVSNMWPDETAITYPGYNSDVDYNDQRVELLQKIALLFKRNKLCIEGSYVSYMILVYLSY